ncbi:MAG: C40 family peptidase [Fimbriimonadaceae bacterium]|nr:C40 family peptidase [Fimbriimonadaceae bacterium]
MNPLDPRLHPYRDDIAAEHLQGQVPSAKFVRGVANQVVVPHAALTEGPRPTARAVSQLLLGEPFTVYESQAGWSWGQCGLDGYVGYVRSDALSTRLSDPTHRVSAVQTLVFAEAHFKSPVVEELSALSRVRVVDMGPRYAELDSGGFVDAAHLIALDETLADFVQTALRYVETPYRWGGRSGFGIDCSGLVQCALAFAGVPALRDTDMQAASLGTEVSGDLRRGDLVYWPGHVAMLLDEKTVVHSASTPLKVCVEPLDVVQLRSRSVVCRRRVE